MNEITLTNGELNALFETIKSIKKNGEAPNGYIWKIVLADDGDVLLEQDDLSVSIFDAIEERKYAYTATLFDNNKFGIGKATEGTVGYTPMTGYGPFPTWDEAQKKADWLNKELGIDSEEAMIIIGRTMRKPKKDTTIKCPSCEEGIVGFDADLDAIVCDDCGAEFELEEQ